MSEHPKARRSGVWALGLGTTCLAAAVAACGEPLEFADWTVLVPEGARVIECADVPAEERENRVELVEDLRVGPRGEDPDYSFFRAAGIAVDDSGRMYVVEMGNMRVQVFGRNGDYIRTLGGPGQGPGELQMPAGIAITEGRVLVHDWSNRRLSVWDLDGNHLGDTPLPDRLESRIFGTGTDSFVGATERRSMDGSEVIDVSLYSIDGTETRRYTTLPVPDDLSIIGDEGGVVFPRLAGDPSFVASTNGDVYATAGNQYQILAFDPSGSPRWALRVARPAPVFTQEHQDAVLEPLRDRLLGLDALEIEWPDRLHTIGQLAIDGHGHLYVFPQVFRDLGSDERVEVYSSEGERLFAGTMSGSAWSAASGDLVYEVRTNPQTQESELVRYRLVEPFD